MFVDMLALCLYYLCSILLVSVLLLLNLSVLLVSSDLLAPSVAVAGDVSLVSLVLVTDCLRDYFYYTLLSAT